jgi:hypothetical protein
MKEQHLAIRSLKDTMHARSCALAHKVQAEAAVKAARSRLSSLRSSGKPEAVLAVRDCHVRACGQLRCAGQVHACAWLQCA